MRRWWEEPFSSEERHVYETYQRGTGGRVQPYGERPALIVVDVTLAFCGRPGQSLEESIREWPPSCGPYAWKAIPHIRRLLDVARQVQVPVVYTTGQPGAERLYGGTVKRRSETAESPLSWPGATDIPTEIAPRDGEFVLQKPKASAFFATPLLAYLHRRGTDSLVFCGTTTSGCVRASVVDGFSWGFSAFVVEEAVFDRSQVSHAVNLYEMNAKYADVIVVDEVVQWLESLGGRQELLLSVGGEQGAEG